MELMVNSFLALFQWGNFLMMLLGTVIGIIVGVLPGIGASGAMALMIPYTWKMDLFPAFCLLCSIWATSKFGGSLTAILFNIPGDVPNASTLIDGFPMAEKGKAKTAVAITATVSIWGGIFSAISIIVFMPLMYKMILTFGPAEFFMLALFGLTTIAAVSGKSIAKGLLVGGVGILISTIGFHPMVGDSRYTFGSLYLSEGVYLSNVILGLLAMSEAVTLWAEGSSIAGEGVPLVGSYKEGIVAVLRNIPLVLRSSLIAWVIGVAPGAGPTVAGFVSYASALKTCKNTETFGKGDPRGLIAADTAIHSCGGGDLLPTIALGIPGATSMAILLGAFLLHGLSPGPQIVKAHLDLVYVIVFVCVLAHIVAVMLALLSSGALEKLTKIRAEIISPVIVVFCLFGAYVARGYWQDMLVTTLFGVLGYYMKKSDYNPTPLVLGCVLGPVAELSFFEALGFSDNGVLTFFTRIPSLIIFLCILTVIFWPYLQKLFKKAIGVAR